MILMCNRTGETIAWTVTTDSVGRIVFFSSDPEGRIINQGKLKGVLLQNDPHSDGSNLRNFRTQLHVYTSIQMTGPINITCSSDGGSNSHAITLSGEKGGGLKYMRQCSDKQGTKNCLSRYYKVKHVVSFIL